MRTRLIIRALTGLGLLWLLNTALTSALAPRYAELTDRLGTGSGGLALALVAQTAGLTVVMLLVAPRLADRWGARPLALVGAVAFALSIPLVGWAGTVAALAGAFAASGAVNAVLDLGMFRLATDVERRLGRTLIPWLDIPAALGGLLGATAGAATAGRVPLDTYAMLVGLVGVLLVLAAWPSLPKPARAADPDAPAADHGRTRLPRRRLAALALLAAAGLGMELSVLDWSSLIMRDLGARPGQLGLGSLGFVGAATLALLVVGPLADRYGRARVLSIASGIGLAAMALLTVAPTPAWAITALTVAGLGLVVSHPLALSAAGAGTAADLATVIAASYVGMALMRAGVGGLATLTGSVQVALGAMTISLCALVLALAHTTGDRPGATTT